MEDKIKILLVEDDQESAMRIEAIIHHLSYQLLETIDNSEEALAFLLLHKPDLLLMDIDIQGKLNGIEVVEKIKHLQIPVIFVTGYDDEYIFQKARKTSPLAYLVKPFNKWTFQNALENAIIGFKKGEYKQNGSSNWAEDILLNDCFFIKRNNILQKVRVREIHYIHSEGNYCEIYANKKCVLKISLSKMLEKLPAKSFVRIHQRYVVQVDLIDNIDIAGNLVYVLGHKLPLGPSFKEKIINLFDRL